MSKILAQKILLCGAMLAFTAASANAAFISPSWTRPTNNTEASSTNTTFQSWDVIGTTGQDTSLGYGPDVANINPNGTATLTDAASPGSSSFFTSGGNIYSPIGVIEPQVTLPGFGTGNETNFLVQMATQGNEIDVTDFTIGGVAVSSLANYSYTELSSTPLGGFGGSLVEHAWQFTTSLDITSFVLDWGFNTSSASLDRLTIDTQTTAGSNVVPEPSSLLLFGLGGLGMTLVRRRRASEATSS